MKFLLVNSLENKVVMRIEVMIREDGPSNWFFNKFSLLLTSIEKIIGTINENLNFEILILKILPTTYFYWKIIGTINENLNFDIRA